MTASDTLGAPEAAAGGMGLGALFARASGGGGGAAGRADVYALRDRAMVLAQLEAPPLVLHTAEAEHRKFPFEVGGLVPGWAGLGCAARGVCLRGLCVRCRQPWPCCRRRCCPAAAAGLSRRPTPPPIPRRCCSARCRACSWTPQRTNTCFAW